MGAGDGGRPWRLLIGDLQVGYEFVTVHYRRADLIASAAGLEALRLTDSGVEVLYDEVDIGLGRPIHRILLWPEGELWVRFDEARVERTPAEPADRR